jgi:hypothetical protein
MTPSSYNLSMVRGDSFAFDLRLTDFDGVITDIAFTAKKRAKDTEAVIAKTFSDGVTKISEGVYRVRVAPQDTSNVEAGRYMYDIQVTMGEDVITPLIGYITIVQDVTGN